MMNKIEIIMVIFSLMKIAVFCIGFILVFSEYADFQEEVFFRLVGMTAMLAVILDEKKG